MAKVSVRIEQVPKRVGSGPSPHIVPLALPASVADEQWKNKFLVFQRLASVSPTAASTWHAFC
jgi:hypothetical protein